MSVSGSKLVYESGAKPPERIKAVLDAFAKPAADGKAYAAATLENVNAAIDESLRSGYTASSLQIGWNEQLPDFRRRLNRLLLITDLVIANNDPIALAESAIKFQRRVEHIDDGWGGWTPSLAGDSNLYHDTYKVTLFNRSIFKESIRYAEYGIPIVYLPTTSTRMFQTDDVSLRREGVNYEKIWEEAVRRSGLFARSALPSLPQDGLLSEAPEYIDEHHAEALLELQVPVIEGLSPEELYKAITDYPEAYLRFRGEFKKILHAAQSAIDKGDKREVELIRSDYLYDEVIRLNQQYKSIQKGLGNSIVTDTVILATFSILAIKNHDLIQLLTGAGALYKVRDLVSSYLRYEVERLGLQESRVFWFWKLLQKKKIPIERLRT